MRPLQYLIAAIAMNTTTVSKARAARRNGRCRLDLLADMGTVHHHHQRRGTLMHPELEEVIRHIRKRGMIAGMITNGFFAEQKAHQKFERCRA